MGIWTRQRAGRDLTGLTHHSDKEVQYLAVRYTQRLAAAGAFASVGSTGDSYDNALAEAFNSLFKAELTRHRGPLEEHRGPRDRRRRVHRLVQPPAPELGRVAPSSHLVLQYSSSTRIQEIRTPWNPGHTRASTEPGTRHQQSITMACRSVERHDSNDVPLPGHPGDSRTAAVLSGHSATDDLPWATEGVAIRSPHPHRPRRSSASCPSCHKAGPVAPKLAAK